MGPIGFFHVGFMLYFEKIKKNNIKNTTVQVLETEDWKKKKSSFFNLKKKLCYCLGWNGLKPID